MSRKRQIYMIVEKNEFELPILVGTNEELCTFLDVSKKSVENALSKKSVVDSKYFIVKIDGYKDVNLDEYENEDFKEKRVNPKKDVYIFLARDFDFFK